MSTKAIKLSINAALHIIGKKSARITLDTKNENVGVRVVEVISKAGKVLLVIKEESDYAELTAALTNEKGKAKYNESASYQVSKERLEPVLTAIDKL